MAEAAVHPRDFVQILSPSGELLEHPRFAWQGSDSDARDLYRDMFLLRRFDLEATALQRHGELGLWPPLTGQEAAQIGMGRAMHAADHAFPSYREHGIAWCRGVDPVRLLAIFRGVDQGGWDAEKHGCGTYTVVVGAQALHAVGYGMGLQRDGLVGSGDPGRDAAVVACFGDGATSQGDVAEAMVFAASTKAPVVFLCQNNQWAISVPVSTQAAVPIHRRAEGYGFPGLHVDGNDVLAMHAVSTWALDHARSGNGPVLIEAETYRMGPHTTTDDPTRYRTEDEVAQWQDRDPIARLRAYLSRTGIADDAWFADVDGEADALGERLRRECRELPDPQPLSVFDHVYSDVPPPLQAQRDAQAEWLAGFEGGDGA